VARDRDGLPNRDSQIKRGKESRGGSKKAENNLHILSQVGVCFRKNQGYLISAKGKSYGIVR
jgi:hypothetical protein